MALPLPQERSTSILARAWGRGLEQLLGTERLSLLREVALVPRDLGAVVPRVDPGDDVVVLVHGFLASGGVFRPLRARLEREAGARVATFTHAPGAGIRSIARRLARLVDAIPRARITVVGHSLGGVVARWYVQEMGGHERVAQTISLASPFGGAAVCHRVRLLTRAELHGQSALLRRVRDGARTTTVPHTSIVAEHDRVVEGIESATLGTGDVVVLTKRGHNTLLFDDEVASLVIDRVRGRRL
jgi:triacylglycerol lipase